MISYQCSRFHIKVSASSSSLVLLYKLRKFWKRNLPLKLRLQLPLDSLLSKCHFSKLALTKQTPFSLDKGVYTFLSFLQQTHKTLFLQRYSSFKQFSHLFNLSIPPITHYSLLITHCYHVPA